MVTTPTVKSRRVSKGEKNRRNAASVRADRRNDRNYNSQIKHDLKVRVIELTVMFNMLYSIAKNIHNALSESSNDFSNSDIHSELVSQTTAAVKEMSQLHDTLINDIKSRIDRMSVVTTVINNPFLIGLGLSNEINDLAENMVTSCYHEYTVVIEVGCEHSNIFRNVIGQETSDLVRELREAAAKHYDIIEEASE